MSGKSIAALRRRRSGNSKQDEVSLRCPKIQNFPSFAFGSSSARCGEKRKRNGGGCALQWILHPCDAPTLVVVFENHMSLDDIIIA